MPSIPDTSSMSRWLALRRTGEVVDHAGVDLWLALLDARDPLELRSCLAPDELARADRLIDANTARRYVAARGILREILGRYLGCGPGDVLLEYGELGKPALRGSDPRTLQFNVSHTGDHAAYAICIGADVGVDIECDDGRIDPGELAPMICSARELQEFQAHPAVEQRALLFRLWTRKEAYLKCLGCGFAAEPSSLEVPTADTPEAVAGHGDLRCSIRTLTLGATCQVSVATRSLRTELRSIRWWSSGAPVVAR